MCLQFYRRAFLRHVSPRYAVMLSPPLGHQIKYREYHGTITDSMLARHLRGDHTLAAPAAYQGQTHLLPLDIDAGGQAAIHDLIDAARSSGLWAFGQYCPRPGWSADQQRGYVWIGFATRVAAQRLQDLGQVLIRAVARPGRLIEARAHAAVTRLPFGRHTHTGRFGLLVLPDTTSCIDDDPPRALTSLQQVYHDNSVDRLLPPALTPPPRQTKPRPQTSGGITIDTFNRTTDLITLLETYGARRARGSRRLMHCCGHPDARRASLLLWKNDHGKHHCKCLSEHHDCPLAGRMRDAFGVYCALEGLTPAEALRTLNEKEGVR